MSDTSPLRKKNTGESGNGGEFGHRSHDASEVSLTGNLVQTQPASTKIPEIDRAQLDAQPELAGGLLGFDGGPGGAADLLVHSITDGQLSRGTPGKAGADALTAWRILAATEAERTGDGRYTQFKRGLEKGVTRLMASKLEGFGPVFSTDFDLERAAQQATVLAHTKRAASEDRERWRQALKFAETDAEWRGMLVAGAALSGTDSWWGFRNDTARTVLGG